MTTVTLRPNGDVSVANVTTTDEVVWGATDDDTDASYADISQFGYVYLNLTTTTLPAGSVMKTLTVRFRAGGGGVTPGPLALVGLYKSNGSGGNTSKIWDAGTYVGVSGTQNYSMSPVPVSLTQAELDNLLFTLQVNPSGGSGQALRLFEVYVDVTYAAIPTVVTGTADSTATPAPTVSWTYTAGSDGGSQIAYQLKVFSSAVYGGGGFSADTSSAVYDSGVVLSGVSSAAVSGLANSTTYKAYVRAAQVVNGVYQWSAWDDGTSWTTSFTAALVSSVTVSGSNSGAYVEVTVNRQTSPNTAWEAVTVERSTDSGVTWDFVRGATEASATNAFVTTWGASSMIVRDYEPANGESVIYRARAFRTVSSVYFAGPWSSNSSAGSWTDSSAIWLKDPLIPSHNTKLAAPRYLSGMRRTRTPYVHDIVGRAAPIVVQGSVLRTINGTTQFRTMTSTAATEFEVLMEDATVVLLQLPASDRWGSRYLGGLEYVEDRPVEIVGRAERFWEVSFVEVDRPEDETA